MNPERADKEPQPAPMSAFAGHFDSPQPSVAVQVEFGAQSRQNPLHAANQDHYLVTLLGRHQETLMTSLSPHETPERFDEFAYGMVIADGMGRAGELASRLAISTLVHLLVHFGKWNVRIDEPTAQEVIARAERFYKGVDAALVHAGRHLPHALQTTLTAVCTAGNELFFAHVGHSRAYLQRHGELLRLTHDHTVVGEHLGQPVTVDVAANARDMHHTLTHTIGRGGTGPRIDIERCGIEDGDAVLLCTNGLTDVVDEANIASALRLDRSPDDQCRALIELAVEAGATDDVTALVARYRIPG